MGLDSYRVKETRENLKKDGSPEGISGKNLEKLQRLMEDLGIPMSDIRQNVNGVKKTQTGIDSLLDQSPELLNKSYSKSKRQGDIDQEWIKGNEVFEDRNNTNNQIQDLLDRMPEIAKFSKNVNTSNEPEVSDDWYIPRVKEEPEVPQQDPIATTTNSIPINNQIDNQILNNPAAIPKQEETEVLMQQLSAIINKKHQFLVNQIRIIYNSNKLNDDVQTLNTDLQKIMDIKEQSIGELKKVDSALNSLISRFARISQKAEELKTKDDFMINQQAKQIEQLQAFQSGLEKKYGKYWFSEITNNEKEQYIQMYMTAHGVSRESVESDINDSIKNAYDEIISQQSQGFKQPEPIEPKTNYSNLITFYGKQAVNDLKQIYATLNQTDSNKVQEFSYLYQSLSALSKIVPTTELEEQQKLTQIQELSNRIEQLKSNSFKVSGVHKK